MSNRVITDATTFIRRPIKRRPPQPVQLRPNQTIQLKTADLIPMEAAPEQTLKDLSLARQHAFALQAIDLDQALTGGRTIEMLDGGQVRNNDAELNEGDIIDGRYRVEKRLGRGGLGAVYLCTVKDSDDGARVAVKLQTGPAEMAADERDAYLTFSGSHPNIIQCLAIGSNSLVLEYHDGQSLSGLIAQMPRALAAAEYQDYVISALWIIREALRGLEYAHSLGEVHADLKPQNIMVRETNPAHYEVTLIDWGLGRSYENRETNTILGSLSYMSPEQALSLEIDHRTDLYATGLIANELLTGSRPFPSNRGFMDVWTRRTSGEAFDQSSLDAHLSLLPSDLSGWISSWIATMTTHAVEARFDSALDARLALEAILESVEAT